MIRISTIFVAICMVLVAASLGLILYSVAGISGSESAIVALTALTFLILYNAVSMRLRDRTDVGSQITDLSRGTSDLSRQIAEFERRLAAVEGRVVSANSTGQDRIQTVIGEINELGVLVKQLAISVAGHDDLLTAGVVATPAIDQRTGQPPFGTTRALEGVGESAGSQTGAMHASPRSGTQILAAVKSAIESNQIEIYLQPMVTLPQRKVRFYEAVTRIRDDNGQILTADDFIATAEAAGLMGRIDHLVMLRCVQVLRRLLVRNKDVGVFCNIAAATLSDTDSFTPCLDFLEANRALAPSFVLEFKQSTLRKLGPVETEHLAALTKLGYRFSVDHVTDLRIEPRELADRGVGFIKVPAALLLDSKQNLVSDIHPSDLSDLLGRFGIDLIAERIEGERAVVDLLDYDVRFGQGFLFAAPRPLRPEATSANGGASSDNPRDTNGSSQSSKADTPRVDTLRTSGNAALARRFVGPG